MKSYLFDIFSYRNEPKIQNGPIVGHNNYGIVANKPPLNHRENRKVAKNFEIHFFY